MWGLPLVFLIAATALYFAFLCRLLPFLRLRHTFDLLRGKFSNPDDPGEIPHFQALSSALSGTIGMGNIAGVAIAISMGGPGAIFWMWVAGLLGMCTKFFTCTLACMYRRQDEDGIAQGGPMYFIEMGLGPKFRPLAFMFAICGMVGCLPLFQANQLAGLLQAEWSVDSNGYRPYRNSFCGNSDPGRHQAGGQGYIPTGADHVHPLFHLKHARDCLPLRDYPRSVCRYFPGSVWRAGNTGWSGRAHFQGGYW